MFDVDTICPRCGTRHTVCQPANPLDQSTALAPGDVSICYGCGEWCVMGQDQSLRAATPEEEVEFHADPLLQKYWRAWRRIRGVPAN